MQDPRKYIEISNLYLRIQDTLSSHTHFVPQRGTKAECAREQRYLAYNLYLISVKIHFSLIFIVTNLS